MLLQKMPQARIESVAENQLVELRQTGKLSYEHYVDADPTPKHPHGAHRKVILLYASGMFSRESHRSQQLGLPLRVMLDTACTCITGAHDAHMCIEATQEPCWLQAAPTASPHLSASRAESAARRLGITSQPDTAAVPGRSPGQPGGAYAAAGVEAADRAVASRSGQTITGNAGGAASSKAAAGGQGHKDAVSSARGGGKSSFLFGAALGVTKRPAAAPAAAAPALAAAAPAAGGEQGQSLPARSAAGASEPLRQSANAAPGGAATSKKQRAQQTSGSSGDRDGHGSGGGGAAQAATRPAFVSQLAAGQPPQVDCSAVLCSTSRVSLPSLAHALHACCIPPADHITIGCPGLAKCDVTLLTLDVVHLHRARRQPAPQQQPRAQANRAGAAGAADAPGPNPSSAQMRPPTVGRAHRQQAAAREQQRPTACRLAANLFRTRRQTPQAVPQPWQRLQRQRRRRPQRKNLLQWRRSRLLTKRGLMQTHWQRSC